MNTPTQLTCDACGTQFDLTPDYLAQYGGQGTTCSCGHALTIPAATAPAAVQLSYAAPSKASAKTPRSAWRDGVALVIARGTRLPNRCAACGTPVLREFRPRSLLRDNGDGALSLQIVLFRRFMSDRVRVRFGYCNRHAPWRMSQAFFVARVAALVVLIPLAYAASLIKPDNPAPFWGCVGLVFAAMAFSTGTLLFVHDPITVAALDYKNVWLTGFGADYLQHFPSLAEQHDRDAAAAAANLGDMAGN